MGKLRLFADFGSTFTKLTAFDLEKETLVARVQAPSTVDTDIAVGFREAAAKLSELAPISQDDIKNTVACSSAAGGLRMLCIGLVPDYTTQAGVLTALGAGAKLVGAYSFELSRFEMEELVKKAADIILLTGGTDGGNSRVIIHNTKQLAAYPSCAKHIVVAGNSRATQEIRAIFQNSGHSVFFTENVMPELGEVNFAPANALIRSLFIRHITQAKGIRQINQVISGVVMPTPSAVFEAVKLLSQGVPGSRYGLGELMAVDVGGATTDVYSVASGRPTQDGVELVGLQEPFAKRTVEGDLGMFLNLDVLAGLIPGGELPPDISNAEIQKVVAELRTVRSIPRTQAEFLVQQLLSKAAVKTATDRHVGSLETQYTPHGVVRQQRGKDLSQLKYIIGSGGPVSFSSNPGWVLSGAIADHPDALLLKPQNPTLLIDSKYILYAIGLLSLSEPEKAFRIAQKYLQPVEWSLLR